MDRRTDGVQRLMQPRNMNLERHCRCSSCLTPDASSCLWRPVQQNHHHYSTADRWSHGAAVMDSDTTCSDHRHHTSDTLEDIAHSVSSWSRTPVDRSEHSARSVGSCEADNWGSRTMKDQHTTNTCHDNDDSDRLQPRTHCAIDKRHPNINS